MKKYFSALCTTLRLCSEPRPVIKIINFHEKAWFSLIFIDFGQIDDLMTAHGSEHSRRVVQRAEKYFS